MTTHPLSYSVRVAKSHSKPAMDLDLSQNSDAAKEWRAMENKLAQAAINILQKDTGNDA